MQRRKARDEASLGILMVKSAFRRYRGDIGNALTFSFPVHYRIVEEALPTRMTELHKASLLAPFLRAADELVEAGVDGITTTCGFLSLYQQELADHCPVPVASSSLLQVPLVERMLAKTSRVGILTFDAEALKGPYLEAVGVAEDTPIAGMAPSSNFVRWIREGDNAITFETLRKEVLALAASLLEKHPEVGAIVSECTNLAPFTYDIRKSLAIPVYDVISLVKLFHAGLQPPRYENP
ncbi:MAG TPA: aspartate/glutamate racemase family protein [Kiloniellales bacterium]|nr:aspartate/glutamate racemase family protein [Kiloniellales bacterium]